MSVKCLMRYVHYMSLEIILLDHVTLKQILLSTFHTDYFINVSAIKFFTCYKLGQGDFEMLWFTFASLCYQWFKLYP